MCVRASYAQSTRILRASHARILRVTRTLPHNLLPRHAVSQGITSRFFPTLDEVAAVGVPYRRGPRDPSFDDGDCPGPGRGDHRLGLDELHIRSADGGTFFVLVLAQSRSARLRPSVAPPDLRFLHASMSTSSKKPYGVLCTATESQPGASRRSFLRVIRSCPAIAFCRNFASS